MRHSKPVRCLIRENGKTGKPENETRLVGTVSNCAYAVRLGNRTYRGAKVSTYFLEFTINALLPDILTCFNFINMLKYN